MQPRSTFRFTVLALALSSPSLAFAQHDDAKDLDSVVVTATRTAVTADAALAAVEVIDRKAIERSAARSLPELLRGRAGVTLVNQGGLGKLSTLFLRGTESDHTLFLVDGIRVGSATSGLASLQDLPLEQIERIEIVRGPRSSLYGADAIGGVIQVFTRRGNGETGVRGRARIGAGSHGLREASAGVDLRGAHGGVGLDIGHQQTDGIDSCRGFLDPVSFVGAGCFMNNPDPDRDGYRNNNASLRADFAAGDAWQFDAQALRARGHNFFDADPAWLLPDNSKVLQQVVGGNVRWRPGEAVGLRLGVGRNIDASDNYLGTSFMDRFETRRDSASLQGDFTLAKGQVLTAGFDWLRDSGGVEGQFDQTRGNRAAFAQYQGRFDAHDLQLSLRRDDNDQFGGRTTGGIAWGFGFADGWRVTASHATAFKAPTFNELYYPYYGNPALRPEASRSSELSLRHDAGAWEWQLNAYRNDIDELIVYDTAIFAANNIETARIRGIELVASTQLGGWDVRGQLGALDARNLSSGFNHGKRLPRRPQRSARLDLDREFGDFGFGISGIAEAARWDDVANTLRVGGHATVDARATWRVAADWTLQASLVNAFDKGYETSAYYNQPGREWGLGLRWQPK